MKGNGIKSRKTLFSSNYIQVEGGIVKIPEKNISFALAFHAFKEDKRSPETA